MWRDFFDATLSTWWAIGGWASFAFGVAWRLLEVWGPLDFVQTKARAARRRGEQWSRIGKMLRRFAASRIGPPIAIAGGMLIVFYAGYVGITRPSFLPSTDVAFAGHAGETTAIFVEMTIVNRGAPSVATTYRLWVDSPSLHLEFLPYQITDDFKFLDEFEQDRHTLKISSQNALDLKTIKPIPHNGMASGWLMFIHGGELSGLIKESTAALTITFLDAQRRETRVVHAGVVRNYAHPALFYCPGLS